MRLRKYAFLSVGLIIFSNSLPRADDDPKEPPSPPPSPPYLKIEKHHPIPDVYTLAIWQFDPFAGGEELWYFHNEKALQKVLQDSALSSEQRENIRANKNLPMELGEQVLYPSGSRFVRVSVPEDLRQSLPRSVIRKVYQSMMKALKLKSPFFITKKRKRDLVDQLRSDGASDEQIKELEKDIFRFEKNAVLLVLPHNWKYLPEPTQSRFVEILLRERISTSGLKITLIVTKESLSQIAKDYAGPLRSEEQIRQELEERLKGRERVEIPVEELLPEWVSAKSGTYSDCHGPNCFNSALQAPKGSKYEQRYEGSPEAELWIYYRLLKPQERLRVGDILVYQDANNELIHMSTYIGNDFVLTKNGLNRYHPYVIQKVETQEKIYFPGGDFRLRVYRKPIQGEQSEHHAGGRIYNYKKKDYYRISGDAHYANLGFRSKWKLREKRLFMKKLASSWLGNLEITELSSLAKDPAEKKTRADALLILHNTYRYQKVRRFLEPIGYHPEASLQKRRAVLEELLSSEKLNADEVVAVDWIQDHQSKGAEDLLEKLSQKLGVKLGAQRIQSCLIEIARSIL